MAENPEADPRTELTVGFVVGVSPDKWARVWAERLPSVPLVLRRIEADAALAELGRSVDMLLARDVDADDSLHAIPLWTETQVVVVPKDHPAKLFDEVGLDDIADENLLDGSDDAALDLVAAGVGVVRMPQSVFRASGRRDVLGRPVRDAEPTRISLVWPRSTPSDDALVAEFIGIVRGRTANSSRGAAEGATPVAPSRQQARTTPPSRGKPARRGSSPSRKGRPKHR